jgi:hypothetical protein
MFAHSERTLSAHSADGSRLWSWEAGADERFISVTAVAGLLIVALSKEDAAVDGELGGRLDEARVYLVRVPSESSPR